MAPTSQANIVVNATDRASDVLVNIAGKLERLNRSLSGFGRNTGFRNVGAGLKLISDQMGGMTKTWERFKGASQWSAGIVAGTVVAGAGLVRMAVAADDAIGKIDDLANKHQLDTDILQGYGHMVEEVGGHLEDAADALGKLKKAQNEAIHGNQESAAAFAGVGISIDELKRMKPEQLLERMADSFKGSNRDLAKQAVLLQTMGKNGEIMMGVLNQGAENIRQKFAQMREEGAILTKEQIARDAKFGDAWDRLSRVFDGLKNALGADLAEKMTPIIDGVRKWVVQNKDLIASKFTEFLERLPEIADTAWRVLKAVGVVVDTLVGAFSWLTDKIGAQNTVWLVLGGALAAPLALFGLMVTKVAVLTVSLGTSLFGALTKLGPPLTSFADKLGGPALSSVKSLTNALPKLQSGLSRIAPLLGKLGAVGAAGAIGYGLGTLANDYVINPSVQKLTGQKDASLGTWLYDKLHPEEANMFGRMTAAQAAAAQRQDIRNQIAIKIDAQGRPRVTDIQTGSPQTQIDVSTGLALAGS